MTASPKWRRLVATLWLLAIFFAAAGGIVAWTGLVHPAHATSCTWGASSITAYVGHDGQIHVTKPHTTGCVPR